ncbi:ankyrin repeat domain-containing protein [Chloropicon primus]|uniref:Ankyrin repeat domain-containing protein n=2 Tax=Chloropicon primus TaxID=1764295 RepID=A0A5B8MGL7_9CHLO|nr:ankyrin repeat domain-containing protein [Chloropicon primus]UPQ98785.1 ankyrin repeat domain-containing protein [Chloropicon primus]|eukprot:QDZ19573.1 ankyrin repeat domain-containing protein [Chloropicon primus]
MSASSPVSSSVVAPSLDYFVEKCLRITDREKVRGRQRPAEISSPRRSLGDCLGLSYEPKRPRRRKPMSPAAGEPRSPPASPAILAMKAKMEFIKACHRGDFEAVRDLVTKFGVSVRAECMALHFASDVDNAEIVEFLLGQGADVDTKDSKRRTALMYAVYKGNMGAARALLLGGADVELQDDFGSTALMYAASGGAVECCRVLEAHGANLDGQNNDGLSALIYAIQNGQHGSVQVLLELGANPYVSNAMGTGALHWASKKGDVSSCRMLLDHGVSVDTLNGKRVTPLMYAADCIPREGTNEGVIKFLVLRGANVNALDEDRSSPLMYAAHSGSRGNVRALLRSGADPSSQNEFGTTPIMYAGFYGHYACLCEFLKHDAGLRSAKDKRDMSVRDWSKQANQTHIVDLLDKMSKYPAKWNPGANAEFPQRVKENVRAILLAAKSRENPHLHATPQDILLKVIGHYSELELWPALAGAQ